MVMRTMLERSPSQSGFRKWTFSSPCFILLRVESRNRPKSPTWTRRVKSLSSTRHAIPTTPHVINSLPMNRRNKAYHSRTFRPPIRSPKNNSWKGNDSNFKSRKSWGRKILGPHSLALSSKPSRKTSSNFKNSKRNGATNSPKPPTSSISFKDSKPTLNSLLLKLLTSLLSNPEKGITNRSLKLPNLSNTKSMAVPSSSSSLN